jgi:hypothetical protein
VVLIDGQNNLTDNLPGLSFGLFLEFGDSGIAELFLLS